MSQKILVVDDANGIRLYMKTVLEKAGYAVAGAGDGEEALEVLRSDTSIALVVSDINMPKMGGIDLARAIRGNDGLKNLPVILMTGDKVDDPTILAGLRVLACLSKPIKEGELIESVGMALE